MKRVGFLISLALALPVAAFAGTVDFTNQSGTLTGSSAGLSLNNSNLIGIEGFPGLGPISGSFGTVSFSTGTLVGTVGNVTTFNSGGLFHITTNGTNGLPATIFTGTFSSQVTLTFEGTLSGGGEVYELDGTISGTWYNGQTASGKTVQDYIYTGPNGWMGTSTFGSGDTFIGTVPEPGTLGLLGAGLVGVAGIVRKQLKT